MVTSTSFVAENGLRARLRGGVVAQSTAAAIAAYALAASFETAVIRWLHPTGLEIAWVSDLALAAAFGTAVYLWRALLTTRHELAERDRTELVLQTQLSIAADIQHRLLPALPTANCGLDCAALMQSAGKIGGDFYDFVETTEGTWIVLVADVSGKGIPAAMALASLRTTFRALARQRISPSQIATHLSAAFFAEWGGTPYVTCIIAAFDVRAGTVTYSNAGHPRGVLLCADGRRWLGAGGPPAGLFADARYEEDVVRVESGDTCVLVTDGVTEALEGTTTFDESLASDRQNRGAAGICGAVMARALAGRGPTGEFDWDDDRTVVVVTMKASKPKKTEEPNDDDSHIYGVVRADAAC